MEILQQIGSPSIIVFFLVVAFTGGVIKGVVGFGMPMVIISGLGSVVAPDVALAGLILPTLLTNLWQALRQGFTAVVTTIRRYRVFLITGGLLLVGSAQLVPRLPPAVMLLLIGVPITIYASAMLAGHQFRLAPNPGPRTEAFIGAVTGFFGGLTGVWGPPTVAMLTSQNTDKRDQIRVQGVIYGLGAVALLAGHIGSGVLRAETYTLSLALVPPALVGIWLGFKIQDRLDQNTFRQVTLWFFLVAGINLVRRGIILL